MARNSYASRDNLPKVVDSLPHIMQTYMQQVPGLTYVGISKFVLDKWVPLQQQISNQVQTDLRAVFNEREHDENILARLSSIENILLQNNSGFDVGRVVADGICSNLQAVSNNLKELVEMSTRENLQVENSNNDSLHLDKQIAEFIQKAKPLLEGLTEQSRDLGSATKDIAGAMTHQLRQSELATTDIRCICGTVDGLTKKGPVTRRQKNQRKVLVFCETCDAWHHGSCVGLESAGTFSCTRL